MRVLALTDPLTGLANRNEFNRGYNSALKMAARYKYQVGLILLDLDKFKPINDTYGHPVGDSVLKKVSNILLTNLRETDIVARLGGDEFAIVLNKVDINYLEKISEKILNLISPPFHIDTHKIKVGLSIGISISQNNNLDPEILFKSADHALLLAKKEGRNTYRISTN